MAEKQQSLGMLTLLFSVTAAIALAGCGGGGTDSPEPAPAPNPAPTQPVPPPPSPPPPPPPAPTGPQVLMMDSAVLSDEASRPRSLAQTGVLGLNVFTVKLKAENPLENTGEPLPGEALQVGFSQRLEALSSIEQVAKAWHWMKQSDGRQLAAISVQSPGALGLRMGLHVAHLPDSAVVYVYRTGDRASAIQFLGSDINALLASNFAAGAEQGIASTWWTPDLGSDEATIEIALPSTVKVADVRVSIPRISHIYRAQPAAPSVQAESVVRASNAGACNLDASCSTFALEANGVAQLSFVRANGNTYNCTGTLLNNWRRDFTPYFITANHCIATQAEASSIQTRWFYRSQSCGASVAQSTETARHNGAQLLYATAATDTAFLRLHDMPPAGATYLGWDARGIASGSRAYGLHHPYGDLLKYSEGNVGAFGNCSLGSGSSITCADGVSGNWARVNWSKGVTEAGSSGSGIFENGRLMGTLSGGDSQCGKVGGSDYYGRFDLVFSSMLWNWLAN